MNKEKTNIISVLALGVLLYGVYKLMEEPKDQPLVSEKKEPSEEEYVSGLIEELSAIKNKNSQTKDKIALLKIKLNQLKQQRK